MPNWCHCKLSVTGPEAQVGHFRQKAMATPDNIKTNVADHTQPLYFGNFVPEPDYPDGIKAVGADASGLNWYTWRYEHWGCKWDASFNNEPLIALSAAEGSDITHDHPPVTTDNNAGLSVIHYEFDTPWSPPYPVIAAIAASQPDLLIKFTWGEPGSDYGGYQEWDHGDCITLKEGTAAQYLSPQDMWF